MRTWLFYKATPAEGGIQVEFRRVEPDGRISTSLPQKICDPVLFSDKGDLDRQVQARVRSSGWVGDGARPADSGVAQVVLRGRW
jgi:hypothetical protein